MAYYRRLRQKGGTYFFTTRLADRHSTLLTDNISLLRAATRATQKDRPFQIDAIVILPAAIHMVWTLPEGDDNFAQRWRALKSRFSKRLPRPDYLTPSARSRGEKGIWQRRFWEHLILSEEDYKRHEIMIHAAPVHTGLVAHPADWPWSSVHRNQRDITIEAGVGYGRRSHRRAGKLHLTR